jgi:hypothetical protein
VQRGWPSHTTACEGCFFLRSPAIPRPEANGFLEAVLDEPVRLCVRERGQVPLLLAIAEPLKMNQKTGFSTESLAYGFFVLKANGFSVYPLTG